MDAACDPTVETVVGMGSSQTGKTEVINNICGFFISEDASPILVIHPTLEMGSAWSKDRLAPMLRDTPCLQGKVQDVRSRDAGNTILHKVFPGGNLTISGANSAASLAGRPKRIVIGDDIDRFPPSAGTEGDPVLLAQKRTTAYWNRKMILFSTPTIKGQSRIESAYLDSDQRKFWVPCPQCHGFQILHWSQVKWPSPTNDGKWKAEKHEPDRAIYLCEHCQAELTHADKLQMLPRGEWRPDAEFKGTAGFWWNELYSPWVPFDRIVANFLAAKKGGPLQLRVFMNTSLAETWEEKGGEKLDKSILYGRREQYGPELPADVVVLTAGADVQAQRIELEVIGWGKGEESWGIQDVIFHGDTTDPAAGAWKALDDFLLNTTYAHPAGVALRVVAAGVDTGFRTQEAYTFTKTKLGRRLYALKGSKDYGRPIVHRATHIKPANVMLFMVGTDTAKATIYSRLKLTEPGPGYMHFPMTYDQEFFEQLTAEKLVTSYHKGYAKRTWEKPPGARNEALDRRVYALAALGLLKPNLERLAKDLVVKAGAAKSEKEKAAAAPSGDEDPPPDPPQPTPKPRPRLGFAKRFGWRGR